MLVATCATQLQPRCSSCDRSAQHQILSHLATTSPSDPPVRAFRWTAHVSARVMPALCAVLRHHTSLTSLDICDLACAGRDVQPAETVAHTLTCLTLLTRLHLSLICYLPCQSGATLASLDALSRAVVSLPALADCSFAVEEQLGVIQRRCIVDDPTDDTPSGSPCKRAKLAGSSGASPSLDPVVAALSVAPCLTALSLSLNYSTLASSLHASGVQGPFSALQKLEIGSVWPDYFDRWAPHLARRLLPTTPLPTLTSLSFDAGMGSTSPATVRRDVDVGCYAALKAAAQPRLMHFRLAVTPSHFQPTTTLGKSLRYHRKLQELDLTVALGQELSVGPVLAGVAGLSTLTCLRFHVDDHTRVRNGPKRQMLDMLRPLSALCTLQSLSLGYSNFCDGDVADGLGLLLEAPLRRLTRLTQLRLGFAAPRDRLAVVAPAWALHWAAVTSLRHFEARRVQYTDLKEVRGLMMSLTGLTELQMCVKPVNAALLRLLGSCATEMPALAKVVLDSAEAGVLYDVEDTAESDWLDGLLHLPCRGHYQFDLRNDSIPNSEYHRLAELLAQRGATVSDKCRDVRF